MMHDNDSDTVTYDVASVVAKGVLKNEDGNHEIWYLVNWKNKSPTATSWEPESFLSQRCPGLLEPFKSSSEHVWRIMLASSAPSHEPPTQDLTASTVRKIKKRPLPSKSAETPTKKKSRMEVIMDDDGSDDNDDQVEEYVVEKILDRDVIDGVMKWQVKWKGYPIDECSWEPIEHLQSCRKMRQDFDRAYDKVH